MPNRFVRDMLMSRYSNDGRNPYGSRGGYVSNRRPRRDRNMGDYDDMDYARGGRRMDRGMNDYDDYARRDYGYDSARYDMRGSDYARRQSDYNMHDMGYEHNIQPWDYRGYDRRSNDYNDYDYDMRNRDYGEVQYGKMSKEDMENWKKHLQNSDGSKGEHFRKEQIEQVARQMGANLNEMGGIDVFAMAVNMMYADYCAVAKKYGVDRPEYYAELAKAFLNDKDFKGKGEEKLWLYYKCIVEQED